MRGLVEQIEINSPEKRRKKFRKDYYENNSIEEDQPINGADKKNCNCV